MSTTRPCDVAGCGGAGYARGLCPKHYKRFRDTGSTLRGRTRDDALMADVLEWIMDGDPLTTLAERAEYERLEQFDLAA